MLVFMLIQLELKYKILRQKNFDLFDTFNKSEEGNEKINPYANAKGNVMTFH